MSQLSDPYAPTIPSGSGTPPQDGSEIDFPRHDPFYVPVMQELRQLKRFFADFESRIAGRFEAFDSRTAQTDTRNEKKMASIATRTSEITRKVEEMSKEMGKASRVNMFTAVQAQNIDARQRNSAMEYLAENLSPIVYICDRDGQSEIQRIEVGGFDWTLASLFKLLPDVDRLPSGETVALKGQRMGSLVQLCKDLSITGWEHWGSPALPHWDYSQAILAAPNTAAQKIAKAIGIDWRSLRPALKKEWESKNDNKNKKKRSRNQDKDIGGEQERSIGTKRSRHESHPPVNEATDICRRSASPAVKLPLDWLLHGIPHSTKSSVSEKPISEELGWDTQMRNSAIPGEPVKELKDKRSRRDLPERPRSPPENSELQEIRALAAEARSSRGHSLESFAPSVDDYLLGRDEKA